MSSIIRFFVLGFFVFGVVLFPLIGGPAAAQQPDSVRQPDTTAPPAASTMQGQGQGTATLTNWPASLPQLLREMGRNAPYLLPRLDSLALEYRYAANDSTSQWSFVLGWTPGRRVLYDGDVRPYEKGPSDVRMVNVELRADVRVDGETVGEMIVAVDSMALRSLPSIYSFEVTVGHERVFLDATPEEARRALAEGVTLDSLVVERMGFVSPEASTSERRRPDDRQTRQSAPRRAPSVYEPRTEIHIGWRVGPRPYYVGEKEGNRTVQPRGRTMGRGTTEANDDSQSRAARRGETEEDDEDEQASSTKTGSKADDDEEEDDDHTSLRAPAFGAVLVVGMLAYAGGTVGLYGRGDTPFGLAAGYTRPGGGFQLHAAVNGAVIGDEAGQRLTLKALGFYDVFSSPFQPAIGLGVQIHPQRENDVLPSASIGLAGNFGPVVLLGGFDVVQGTPEVGVTYNFRYERPGKEADGK